MFGHVIVAILRNENKASLFTPDEASSDPPKIQPDQPDQPRQSGQSGQPVPGVPLTCGRFTAAVCADFLSFIRTLELVTGMKSLNLFDATAVLIAMVVLAGPYNEVRSMISGRYRLPREREPRR